MVGTQVIRGAFDCDANFLATIEELKLQLKTLAEENGQLRYERDVARASMLALVPIATDEQEQEFIREMQTAAEPGGLAKLIAELEAAHG